MECDKVIELVSITKSFNHKKILKDISFHLTKGEIFGFLGPNGAGKTTTMRILLGLLIPDSGKALVYGENLSQKPALKKKVGVMLEGHGMYEELTALQNLGYYADIFHISHKTSLIKNLLEQVGLSQHMNEKVGTFSSGMKKRLSLARALLNNPKILFLDEPTAGLDPEAQIEFRNTITQLAQDEDTTVFLNSHNLHEVQKVCRKVAILDQGEIKCWDTIASLQEKFSEPGIEFSVSPSQNTEEVQLLLENSDTLQIMEHHGTFFRCSIGEKSVGIKDLFQMGIEAEEFRRFTKSLEDLYLEIVKKAEEKDAVKNG